MYITVAISESPVKQSLSITRFKLGRGVCRRWGAVMGGSGNAIARLSGINPFKGAGTILASGRGWGDIGEFFILIPAAMRVTSPALDTEHFRYMGLQVYCRVTTGEDVDQLSRRFGFLGLSCSVQGGGKYDKSPIDGRRRPSLSSKYLRLSGAFFLRCREFWWDSRALVVSLR